nr:uncharacterized protein LOC128690035 isoform X1 [Cherax quadricarinatus]
MRTFLKAALLVTFLSLCTGASVKEHQLKEHTGNHVLSDDSSCDYICVATDNCIPFSWLCDGVYDCPGGDDEANCDFTEFTDIVETTDTPNNECEEPFDLIYGRCVMVDPFTSTTWDEARYLCEKFSSELLVIDSLNFYSKLLQFIREKGLDSESYWIGASDAEEEGVWKWVNGEPVTMGTPMWALKCDYSDTYTQEPDVSAGVNQDCAFLDQQRFFYLNDDVCDNNKGAICQLKGWGSSAIRRHAYDASTNKEVKRIKSFVHEIARNHNESHAGDEKRSVGGVNEGKQSKGNQKNFTPTRVKDGGTGKYNKDTKTLGEKEMKKKSLNQENKEVKEAHPSHNTVQEAKVPAVQEPQLASARHSGMGGTHQRHEG